jgi:hypothetical protein
LDKNWVTKFLIYVVIIMILVPVLTNILMFVGEFKVAGDAETWIGYFGSFWGAIIGGIISGAITLIGVRLTITNQDRKEFIAMYPERKMITDTLLNLCFNSMKYLQTGFGPERNRINMGDFHKNIDSHITSIQNYLKEITKIDGKAYFYAKNVIDNLREVKMKSISYNVFEGDEEDDRVLEGYHVTNKQKYNNCLENVQLMISEIEAISKELDKKYNKFTGNY